MKKYETPELEIVRFSTEDVITTSLILDDNLADDNNTETTPWL